MAVGGHGKVFDTERVKPRDEVFHANADQRLSARDSYLANAKAQKDVREAVQLRPGENFIVVAVILGVGGAAVYAAEIAAVRDRNAQVRDLPAEFVLEGHHTLFSWTRPP